MKKKGKLTIFTFVAILVLSISSIADPAIAKEKTIVLTYSNPYSLKQTYARAAKVWINRLEETSNGRLKIKAFWGGTLISGRETLAELEKGVADIALGSVFTKSGYEILWAMGAFMLTSPSPQVTERVSKEIYDMFPEYQKEFEGLIVLGFRNCYNNVMQSTKPINKLDDLKGLIINSSTPGDVIFPKFGARTIKIPPPEWYTAIQKGTYQGHFLQLETLKSFRIGEVVNYVNTDITIPTGGIPMTFMNLQKFKSLPEDLQRLILDSQKVLAEEQMKAWGQAEKAGLDFANEQKVEFVKLPKEDVVEWKGTLIKLGQKEAEKLEKIGKPGLKIMKATLQLIEKYGTK